MVFFLIVLIFIRLTHLIKPASHDAIRKRKRKELQRTARFSVENDMGESLRSINLYRNVKIFLFRIITSNSILKVKNVN